MSDLYTELDNPIWHALSGPHTTLGTVTPLAGLYHADITPFAGLQEPSAQAFAHLADITAPDRLIALSTPFALTPPEGWQVVDTLSLAQFICDDPRVPRFKGDACPVQLSTADAEAMLALTNAAQPGPFGLNTLRCGHYIGVRAPHATQLVAMAGERMRLNQAVEISGVCTAASHRGQGLAGLLTHTLTVRALDQGLLPFLHVQTSHTSAIRLYETLGFRHRKNLTLTLMKRPETRQ